MWIAALVLEHSLCLCDRDAHFDHLPQLTRLETMSQAPHPETCNL
jgi:hypothetical protein